MKTAIESRRPEGVLDYIALAVTTFGVGYLPLMPGTFGSAVGVAIYLGISRLDVMWEHHWAPLHRVVPTQAQAVSIAVFLIFPYILGSLLDGASQGIVVAIGFAVGITLELGLAWWLLRAAGILGMRWFVRRG